MSPLTRHHRLPLVLWLLCLVLTGGQLWASEAHWYVAARFGEASVDSRFGARHPKWIDDQSTAATIDLGYEVSRYLAVEVGYQDLGSLSGRGSPCRQSDDACIERLATFDLCAGGFACTEVLARLEAELSGLSFALVPTWPVNERLSLRGKVGLLAWDAEVTARQFETTERFDGEELLAGIGVQVDLNAELGLLLQHEELDLDAGTTSLGLRWRF